LGEDTFAIKAGGAVHVTRCAPVEVIPRSHKNCLEEIPALFNGTEIFIDPISYFITLAGSPVHCNDIAPPEYKLGGKCYCCYPELRVCHNPAMLPVDEIQIETLRMNDIRL
jgi:hypothetical protein